MEHAGRREGQEAEDEPGRRIQDAGLRVGEERRAARLERVPEQRSLAGQALGQEPAAGEEVVQVIARDEDLALHERGDEGRERSDEHGRRPGEASSTDGHAPS
jgi:hypothetical protein